jgi:methyl-accepting chemotaxis protein
MIRVCANVINKEERRTIGSHIPAMSQIDQMTQSTAAGVVESAAASKELAYEAKSIRTAADDLVLLVKGSK